MTQENILKPIDLMIGDWVYNHRKWECPIVEIHKDSAVVIARHYGEEEFKLSDLEPIPLTPEILEKNGFNPFKVGYEPKNLIGKWWDKTGSVFVKQYCLSNESYRNGYTVFMVGCGIHSRIGDIIYVHQLQHALKLCGIEKEIEI